MHRSAFILAMLVISLGFGGVTVASENKPVLLDRTELPNELQKAISTLLTAAEAKDIYKVIESVAPEFRIHRDFGGMFIEDANAVTNFLQAFPLDDSKLFPEYVGIGWQYLTEILSGAQVQELRPEVYCTFGKEFHNDMVLDEKLCFGKSEQGHWRVISKINGGD